MKKLAVLVLVLALMVPATCAFAATPAEMLGEWYISSTVDDDVVVTVLTGDTLTLNRDSSAVLTLSGIEQTYAWEATDEGAKLEAPDGAGYSDIDVTLEDGQLKFNTREFGEGGNSFDFVFTREPVEVALPAVITAEKEDDYFGSWSCVYLTMGRGHYWIGNADFEVIGDGIYYVPENYTFKIDIEFAQATITESTLGDPITVMTDYADGKLVSSGKALDGFDFDIELAEDNWMIVTIAEEDVTVQYYFTKDGAEASAAVVAEAEDEGADD